MDEVMQELIDARRSHNAARTAVETWMREQGELGILTQNWQAPGWSSYEAALERWHRAVAALDGALS